MGILDIHERFMTSPELVPIKTSTNDKMLQTSTEFESRGGVEGVNMLENCNSINNNQLLLPSLITSFIIPLDFVQKSMYGAKNPPVSMAGRIGEDDGLLIIDYWNSGSVSKLDSTRGCPSPVELAISQVPSA
jgi:hypothetical protein